jgi:hypothetical protein
MYLTEHKYNFILLFTMYGSEAWFLGWSQVKGVRKQGVEEDMLA